MSLDHLVAVADEFAVTIREETAHQLKLDFAVIRPSGAADVILLIVRDVVSGPRVYEDEPRRFPAACLERHINTDGSFCLQWSEDDDHRIQTNQEARGFWSRVDKFLNSQITASMTKRWPGRRNARAHGAAAAHQAIAEKICEQLGMFRNLQRGELSVEVDRTWRKERLTLFRGLEKIARSITGRSEPLWVAQLCPCGSGLSTSGCADHALLLVKLSNVLLRWRKEHEAFIRAAVRSGQRCCGTMEHCELRDASRLVSDRPRKGASHG